jgi:16S rRNA (adenine1518-N6/adenine1519-N6)-dimethyltransferase
VVSDATSVTVIEVDQRAVVAMRELEMEVGDRLHIVAGDARDIDVVSLVPAPRQLIANLPYNVATPLLIGWLRQADAFERLTLMFQLEVAERICAAPGSAAYGRLSVLAQWTCRTELMLRIPPSAFVPPPKVYSAVVSFVPREVQPDAALFARMETLTAAAFGQRRKMLRGALKSLGGQALLAAAGIAPERRAETLSVAEFDRLARLISDVEAPESLGSSH